MFILDGTPPVTITTPEQAQVFKKALKDWKSEHPEEKSKAGRTERAKKCTDPAKCAGEAKEGERSKKYGNGDGDFKDIIKMFLQLFMMLLKLLGLGEDEDRDRSSPVPQEENNQPQQIMQFLRQLLGGGQQSPRSGSLQNGRQAVPSLLPRLNPYSGMQAGWGVHPWQEPAKLTTDDEGRFILRRTWGDGPYAGFEQYVFNPNTNRYGWSTGWTVGSDDKK